MDEMYYYAFCIGYDFMRDYFKKSENPECDVVFEKCKKLSREFIKSKEYNDIKYSSYEQLEKWINANKDKIYIELNKNNNKAEIINNKIIDLVYELLDKYGYKDYDLKYIIKNRDENENTIAIATKGETILKFNPFEKDFINLEDWAFNWDEELFEELEWNKEIIYMTDSCHYDIWCNLSKYYPNKYNNLDGIQEYLKYCKKKHIDYARVQSVIKNSEMKDILMFIKNTKEPKHLERDR